MPPWVSVFIVLAAVAIVVQMVIFAAMYFQFRTTTQQLRQVTTDLQRKIDPILTRANRILETSEEKIASIVSDAAEMTRMARGQAQRMDRIVGEALERMRGQVVRLDTILTGVLEAVDDAGLRMRRSFLGPLQQASAVLKGIRTGIDFIRGQRGARSTTATHQDEELFI